MDKELVKKYLLDFHEKKLPELIHRDITLGDSSKIQTVIGSRRSGKSYLMFQTMKELLLKGIEKNQILYLNFENPALSDINYKELNELIESHISIFPNAAGKMLYIFVDEPQGIEKWENGVRSLHDDSGYKVFITGSSSKLLSKEIATSLRGRALTTSLFTLSFYEYLKFKGIVLNPDNLSTFSKAKLLNVFSEYLKFGGYPEVVLENDNEKKIKIIKDYFDLVVYKDIVERYSIKNSKLIKLIINMVVRSTGKEISLNKIFLSLKSQGRKISKNTLYEYYDILEDSFFAFALNKFDYSIKNEGLSIPKTYLNDIGFLNLFSIEDNGIRLENIVFMELKRKMEKNPLMKINYWKSLNNKENDFVIRIGDKVSEAIQVCYNLYDNETKEREFSGILSCMKYFKLKKGIVITLDDEGEKIVKGYHIKIIPCWKWLLTKK